MSQFHQTGGFSKVGIFEPAIAGLTATAGLSPHDAVRLRQLINKLDHYPAGVPIASVGNERGPKLILSGWASETRVLSDSRRQIFSLLIPGDVFLSSPAEQRHSFALISLTRMVCVNLDPLLEQSNAQEPTFAEVIRRALRHHEERRYDAVLRLGQLSASERTIHLLLELRDRMRANGTASGDRFRIPLTQEHLADALGLSLVHINRTLKGLRQESLMTVRSGAVSLLQPTKLAAMALRRELGPPA